MYVVFWRKGNRVPDLEPRPLGWCSGCDREVGTKQAFKTRSKSWPMARWGRYRAQYIYVCSTTGCGRQVEPYVLPAASAIDWSATGERIGDRTKPLSDKTLARIRAGLARYGIPQLVPSGGTWNEDAQPVNMPFRARTTRENEGLVVPVEGRIGNAASPTWEPIRTQTTRHESALVVPYYSTSDIAHPADRPIGTLTTVDRYGLAFIAELRGGGSTARDVRDPLATVTANGNHHMLVRHNTARGSEGYLSTPVEEPMRTLTTAGHQSLVGWRNPAPQVEDCTFRMLTVPEIQAAMAFTPGYIVTGNKREQVRQLGNGVTPPAAEFLVRAVANSLGHVA